MSIFNRKAVKQNRFRVNEGMPGIKAFMYRIRNKPYLDVRIYRGYREISRIVTPDNGMDTFTVEEIGTFIMPKGEQLLKQYHDKNAIYLCYNLNSCSAGIPVDAQNWTEYEYPPLQPAEFQNLLEAQTIADLLSETQKDLKWIWYLLIGGIIIFAIIMLLSGGS